MLSKIGLIGGGNIGGVLAQEIFRYGHLLGGRIEVIVFAGQQPAGRLGQGLGQVALTDETQLHEQGPKQAAFLGLQANHLFELFRCELA